jgi:alginate O-acetyltransferase complex protein AlgI
MVFSSIIFVIWFLPLFLLSYFVLPRLIPRQNKIVLFNWILLIASLLFYAWDTPIFLFVMLLSIFMNYSLGILIGRTQNGKTKKMELVISIVANLALLGYFKYSNFAIDTLNQCLGTNIPI